MLKGQSASDAQLQQHFTSIANNHNRLQVLKGRLLCPKGGWGFLVGGGGRFPSCCCCICHVTFPETAP